jgi:hypothetical protein
MPRVAGNDNGELVAEIRALRAELKSALASNSGDALPAVLKRIETAIVKSGGDQSKVLQEVRGELAHATSVQVLARKHRKAS